MGGVAEVAENIVTASLEAADWVCDQAMDAIDTVDDFVTNTFFGGSSGGSSQLAEAPSYDEKTATIDETAVMNKLLEEEREQFKVVCTDLENELFSRTTEIYDYLLNGIDALEKDLEITINKKRLIKQFEEYHQTLKGSIFELVSGRLRLSDSECAEALKKSGDERPKAVNSFIRKVVRQGLKTAIENYETTMHDLLLFVHDVISAKIDDRRILIRDTLVEIEAMTTELSKDEFKGKQKDYELKLLTLQQVLTALQDIK